MVQSRGKKKSHREAKKDPKMLGFAWSLPLSEDLILSYT